MPPWQFTNKFIRCMHQAWHHVLMLKKPSDIRGVLYCSWAWELTLSLSLSHPQKTKPSCGVPMIAGSRVPKLEVPNFVKNQKMGFEPCNCILGETRTGICTRLLCPSRTDPSSLARELQLFCWKAQKLSYIESKSSLLTNCKQRIGSTQSFTLTLCIF